MNIKYTLLPALITISFSCQTHQNTEEETTETLIEEVVSLDPQKEIEKWKQELLLNGEIGPPCIDDMIKWQEDNPNQYFGLPDEIHFKAYDLNQDSILDYVFYFNPGDPCGGGNTHVSDFIQLVYSNIGDFIYNKNITKQIENSIKAEFVSRDLMLYGDPLIFLQSFDTSLGGEFVAWSEEDPHCCPSYRGTFSYDLATKQTKLNFSESDD